MLQGQKIKSLVYYGSSGIIDGAPWFFVSGQLVINSVSELRAIGLIY